MSRRVPDNELELIAREAELAVLPADHACLPIEPDLAVVVVGARCRQPVDRTIVNRASVRSLQVLTRASTIVGGALDRLGSHGLRGATPDLDRGRIILNTGDTLTVLDVGCRTMTPLDLDRLTDVHEVTLLANGWFLVANSGADEVIELDVDLRVTARLALDGFRNPRAHPIDHERPLAGALSRRRALGGDHFHVNHAFVAHDGHRYALVHHIEGFRPIAHTTDQLIRQGSGGILDLDAHRYHTLRLRAPHSTRSWGDGYLVLDSGRHRIVTLDRWWYPTGAVRLPGWGRGAEVGPDGTLWIGTSATRTRYRRRSGHSVDNGIIALDAQLRTIGQRRSDDVDEIWAVHVVPAAFAADLLGVMSSRC